MEAPAPLLSMQACAPCVYSCGVVLRVSVWKGGERGWVRQARAGVTFHGLALGGWRIKGFRVVVALPGRF